MFNFFLSNWCPFDTDNLHLFVRIPPSDGGGARLRSFILWRIELFVPITSNVEIHRSIKAFRFKPCCISITFFWANYYEFSLPFLIYCFVSFCFYMSNEKWTLRAYSVLLPYYHSQSFSLDNFLSLSLFLLSKCTFLFFISIIVVCNNENMLQPTKHKQPSFTR